VSNVDISDPKKYMYTFLISINNRVDPFHKLVSSRVPRLSDTRYTAKGSAGNMEICKQQTDFFRDYKALPSDYYIILS